jgi:thiamine biosynthesis protein ThiS
VQIQINGESRDVANQSTIEDLVRELTLPPQRIAIELNHNVVRRSEWRETILNDGDRIEIVHFVGGGTTVGSKQEDRRQEQARN